MAPPLLALRDVYLTFGSTPLLTGADLAVYARDRVCLVGRNGSGKSTLMKIAAGTVEIDSGERFLQPGVTVEYLPQEPDLSAFATLKDYVLSGLGESDDPHLAIRLLSDLGLTGDEECATVSGGEARRAALARVLAKQPDILLLDEPTNHLDLPAIQWLEEELAALSSAIVMISHDRAFLEKLSRSTVWVDRGKTRQLDQNFGHFEKWRDEQNEAEALEQHKLDRKIVREEHWVTHGVSGRRKRNVRRLQELSQLRKKRAEWKMPSGSVALQAAEGETSGKLVARIEKISKSFGDRCLVDGFSSRIARGERIGIVGPNGSGKTTLVNLLTGTLPPDSGKVTLGANLDMLVVDQKRDHLTPELTVKDALTGGGTDLVSIGETRKHVQAYMKDFLFLPEQAGTPVKNLSGGERGRLVLAMQLRHPSNLLVLDEPTNDLDLETLDLLQEMLADYEGTVIVVSHDRDFIDRVCTSVIVPEGGGKWVEYAGGYSDMIAQRGSAPFGGRRAKKKDKPADSPKPMRQKATASKLNFKDKHELETLPGDMQKLESEIEKLNDALAEPDLFESNPKRFQKLIEALEERQTKLQNCEERWLELEMKREELEG